MPWSLAEVMGQDATLHRLNREAAAGRLAHAYLFEGRPGTGKLTLAHGLAARCLCMHPDADGNACRVCRSCHMLAGGNHPDYLELPRDVAELRIGRIVERTGPGQETGHQPLLDFLRLKPVEGGRRIAVIPDAERLRTEAANAFLKTLEEPPPATLLLLTTGARDRLPLTVVSRCRRVGVRPLPDEVVAAGLEQRGLASGDDARELAAAADGSLGVAAALAGGETPAFWRWLRREAFREPGLRAGRDLADRLVAYGGAQGENAGKRKNALLALEMASSALRRRLRDGGDAEKTASALEALWTAADEIGQNVRPDLVLTSSAFAVMSALR